MLCHVWVVMTITVLLVQRANSLGSIRLNLFCEGNVHAHVKEWIGLSFCEILVGDIVTLNDRVVLGVLRNDSSDQDFQRLQRQILLFFLPGLFKKAAQL